MLFLSRRQGRSNRRPGRTVLASVGHRVTVTSSRTKNISSFVTHTPTINPTIHTQSYILCPAPRPLLNPHAVAAHAVRAERHDKPLTLSRPVRKQREGWAGRNMICCARTQAQTNRAGLHAKWTSTLNEIRPRCTVSKRKDGCADGWGAWKYWVHVTPKIRTWALLNCHTHGHCDSSVCDGFQPTLRRADDAVAFSALGRGRSSVPAGLGPSRVSVCTINQSPCVVFPSLCVRPRSIPTSTLHHHGHRRGTFPAI
ncbi:hypothetical protein BGZ61DRAFT_446951 [Ilyonectria robusta]|uniref:uncharacterized protein n=1 Tax=Ilyonectria robusta TaxID=1079257 RepID=UPI001E8D8F56|nr:uncharacterized protein BGZ61DRAFT_446951 [Ilyonectria robusta]KAH8729752.1 hypothetical protein BGZ61DRAFT_446951 [Ilyonectria robusta]